VPFSPLGADVYLAELGRGGENRASAHLDLTSADLAELAQSITALQKYPADFAVQVSIERSANRR
jgi:hypothetical protein